MGLDWNLRVGRMAADVKRDRLDAAHEELDERLQMERRMADLEGRLDDLAELVRGLVEDLALIR